VVRPADIEERVQERFAQALTTMSGCEADFVDPQRWRFVGMYVMDGGCEADYQARIDCHGYVVPGIGKELFRECGVNRIIEHLRRDLRKNVFVTAL
jgi:hypothetical protein